MKSVYSRKQKTFGLVAFGLFSNLFFFQNCSKTKFTGTVSSVVVGQHCIDVFDNKDVSLQPKLKWDWYQKLDKTDSKNFPDYKQVMATAVTGDLNNDGQTEVVFMSFNSYHYVVDKPGVLRIVDGKTGLTIKSVGGPGEPLAPLAAASPLLIDLNGDKKLEIIFVSSADNRKIVALNFDGSHRWTYTADKNNADHTGLSAADINADGKADVLINGAVISEDSNSLPVKLFNFNSNSNRQLAYSLDPSKPRELQIISTSGVYDSRGNLLFSYGAPAHILSVADVDPKSIGIEIISSGGGFIYIMSGLDGRVLRSIDFNTAGYGVGGGITSIGNFDENIETTEIALATDRALLVFTADLQLIASSPSQDFSSRATSVVSFDRNGDGKPEIIYGDEEYLRIYEIANGTINVLNKIVNHSGTLYEYPVFADLDNNGSAELLVVSNSYAAEGFYSDPGESADRAVAKNTTGVRAFEAAGQKGWMRTRKIHNQFYYNPLLVSDSGAAAQFTPFNSFLNKTFLRNAMVNAVEKSCTPITNTVNDVK